MKISIKLISAFIIVAAICAFVGMIGIFGLRKSSESIYEIGGRQMPSVIALDKIKMGGEQISTVMESFLDPNLETETREVLLASISTIRSTYEPAFEEYETLITTPEQREKWEAFCMEWDHWRNANNLFLTKIKAAWALDIGNPDAFHANIEIFRGDHYKGECAVLKMVKSGETYKGGEDATACNYGKWLGTFESSNSEILGIVDKSRTPHDHFHEAVAEAKKHVHEGDLEAASKSYDEKMAVATQQVFESFEELRGFAKHAKHLYHQAHEQSLNECRQAKIKSFDMLDSLIDDAINEASAAVETGNAVSATSQLISVIAVVAGVIIAIVFGLFIARSITSPMSKIVDRIKDIAEGEGDLTQRVNDSSKDELGQLGKWFNTFVEKVHGIVVSVKGISNEVADATVELSQSSNQMAVSMDTSSAQVREMSSAIEEMSQSIIEVAHKGNEAAKSADESRQIARDGGDVVSKTIDGMQHIDHVVRDSSKSVSELGRRGEEIGAVITVINDIADQTNLLALNAAIEAARAGEHGRGFAVVADEVRKLADRTTKATEEIGESIKAIQTETQDAVGKINDGSEQVALGVSQAEKAGASLTQIVSSADEVMRVIQSIAAAAEQQSAASEQISRNVVSVSNATDSVSQTAQESKTNMERLSHKAEQLREMMSQFKTHVGNPIK